MICRSSETVRNIFKFLKVFWLFVISNSKKYHSTVCLSTQNFAQALFIFTFGIYNDPERNWKQCLCKILGGQTKNIMVFFVLANWITDWEQIKYLPFETTKLVEGGEGAVTLQLIVKRVFLQPPFLSYRFRGLGFLPNIT